MSQAAPIGFPSSLSPYDQTQVFDQSKSTSFHPVSFSVNTQDDRKLFDQLSQTIETIKVFFYTDLKLVGIDNKGKIPHFFVKLTQPNAYYHPGSEKHPECFKFHTSYVSYPEVVCHEFTHGVIENLNPLGNKGEAGALNEAISDVVAIVVKHRIFGKSDWKIAHLRDLSGPFTVKELGSFTDPFDHGNVHRNSRLISHAFYLASKDLEHDPVYQEYLLKIWFSSMLSLEQSKKTFKDFALRTVEFAQLEIIKNAIIKGWKGVRIEEMAPTKVLPSQKAVPAKADDFSQKLWQLGIAALFVALLYYASFANTSK